MPLLSGVAIGGIWIGYWVYWHTYTHHSELQVITTLSLFPTFYKSPQQPISLFPACCVLNSRSLATGSNSRDSSAPGAHTVTLRRISATEPLSNVNSTIEPSLLSLPCRTQLHCHPFTELSDPPTNYFTSPHFTSVHWTELKWTEVNWQLSQSQNQSQCQSYVSNIV
jgi:hypothetical protein